MFIAWTVPAFAQQTADNVQVVTQKWARAGFGSVGVMDITVKNQNPFAVKDLVVTCDFAGRSGTRFGERSRTIFDVVEAGETKTFRKINMGFISDQAHSGGCEVSSALRR